MPTNVILLNFLHSSLDIHNLTLFILNASLYVFIHQTVPILYEFHIHIHLHQFLLEDRISMVQLTWRVIFVCHVNIPDICLVVEPKNTQNHISFLWVFRKKGTGEFDDIATRTLLTQQKINEIFIEFLP